MNAGASSKRLGSLLALLLVMSPLTGCLHSYYGAIERIPNTRTVTERLPPKVVREHVLEEGTLPYREGGKVIRIGFTAPQTCEITRYEQTVIERERPRIGKILLCFAPLILLALLCDSGSDEEEGDDDSAGCSSYWGALGIAAIPVLSGAAKGSETTYTRQVREPQRTCTKLCEESGRAVFLPYRGTNHFLGVTNEQGFLYIDPDLVRSLLPAFRTEDVYSLILAFAEVDISGC